MNIFHNLNNHFFALFSFPPFFSLSSQQKSAIGKGGKKRASIVKFTKGQNYFMRSKINTRDFQQKFV